MNEFFSFLTYSPLFFFLSNIDKIDDMMQDITEQQDRAQEISDAISRPFGEVYDEVKVFNLKFFVQNKYWSLCKNGIPQICCGLLGWTVGRAAGAGRAGYGGKYGEHGWTSQCAQLQTSLSTPQSARM